MQVPASRVPALNRRRSLVPADATLPDQTSPNPLVFRLRLLEYHQLPDPDGLWLNPPRNHNKLVTRSAEIHTHS